MSHFYIWMTYQLLVGILIGIYLPGAWQETLAQVEAMKNA